MAQSCFQTFSPYCRSKVILYSFQRGTHAGPCNWLEQFLNLRCTTSEAMTPKVVARILWNTQINLIASIAQASPKTQTKPLCKPKMHTLISSINVISKPHGWGRLTISLSKSTLVICSWIISWNKKQISECNTNFGSHLWKAQMLPTIPDSLRQRDRVEHKRSSGCGCLDNVTDLQQRSKIDSGPLCQGQLWVSDKCP